MAERREAANAVKTPEEESDERKLAAAERAVKRLDDMFYRIQWLEWVVSQHSDKMVQAGWFTGEQQRKQQPERSKNSRFAILNAAPVILSLPKLIGGAVGRLRKEYGARLDALEERSGLRLRGVHDPAVSDYRENDLVVVDGSLWIAKRNDPGPLPGDGWLLAVMRGARGKTGPAGGLTADEVRRIVAEEVNKMLRKAA